MAIIKLPVISGAGGVSEAPEDWSKSASERRLSVAEADECHSCRLATCRVPAPPIVGAAGRRHVLVFSLRSLDFN